MITEMGKARLMECLQVIHRGYEPVAVQFGLTNDNCPYRGRADLPLTVLQQEFLAGIKMYGYQVENNIVAFVSINVNKDAIKINDIVVLPEYWNKGIGTALLEFVKDRAAELELSKITLGMIDDNRVLKKWYEKNGFRNIGYVKYPKAPFTVGNMELILR